MTETLSVYVNGNNILQYDKNTRHPGKQRQFFDGMEHDMDEGIELNGEFIQSPDKMQRAHYVAMILLYGIEQDGKEMLSATCGYLTTRLPELKEIHAIEKKEEVELELIFNQAD